MSEYQYYEWQTIDRVLTPEEQSLVDRLSSHIDMTASQAVVTYEWGDFKHDPKEVLLKYFDAHLYMANWGSRRLMFRFPKGLPDEGAVELYCVFDYISFETDGDYQVMDLSLDEEEGFGWVEAKGVLSTFTRLRKRLMGFTPKIKGQSNRSLPWPKALSSSSARGRKKKTGGNISPKCKIWRIGRNRPGQKSSSGSRATPLRLTTRLRLCWKS